MTKKEARKFLASKEGVKMQIHDDMFDDEPDGAFFALAEEQGIDVEDWAVYQEAKDALNE